MIIRLRYKSFLISYILLLIPAVAKSNDAPDLYKATDDVIRLDSTSFIPTVFHQNKNVTYMVQFYNTFCGHCQMFSPVYKELATRVKNWTSVVRIAGVDCSKDENVITCSENSIQGYPTILIFPPNARVQDPKDAPLNLRSLNIEWTVDDIEESIIDYIENLSRTNREYPLVVNALSPITVSDFTDVKRLYPQENDYGHGDFMFIVESDKSYLGRKLILEYFRIWSKLELRRILLSNTKLLERIMTRDEISKLKADQPVLLRIPNQQESNGDSIKAQVLVRGESDHILPTSPEHEREDFIYDRFKTFFEHFYQVELKEHENSSDAKPAINPKPKRVNPFSVSENAFNHSSDLEIQYLIHSETKGTKKVFAIDLLKGISYMLTHEVKIKGDLTPNEYNTVRNLLTILKKYLPLEKWDSSVNKFVMEMRTRLDKNRTIYEKQGIKAQEMLDILDLSGGDGVRLRFSRENWVSCYESDLHNKGYTCSLWLLFHTMTVGEYVKAAPVRTRPTMVLTTMRDYITKFLGCTVCASNFEKETESLEDSLSSRNSSVLWLWRTHNFVTQRLNNEKPDGKRALADIIFPNHQSCSDCLETALTDIGRDGKTFEDIEWKQVNVLKHLIEIYRPDKVVSPIEMAILLSRIKGKVNYDLMEISTDTAHAGAWRLAASGADLNQSEQWNVRSIFSTGDISLCLILYLTCIMIVAIVCVALNPKWTRFNKVH